MKLVFHEAALADLQSIQGYISKDNPAAAVTVVGRIKSALDRLTMFPHSGRAGTDPGTYEVIVPDLPYIVVYEVMDAQVDILAVFHAAQDRP